jgi:uncharacterized protein YgbK (DUF1537 family)
MIVVLADDFSGAAELAGIAADCGLKAEVHTRFDPDSTADVIAVDTDTRWRTEAEAIAILKTVTREIHAARPSWIYKKTDSVLRGHVRAEIEAVLDVTGHADCLLIPANPSKARIIQLGHYFIQGVPLHETIFAQDPDHPRHSSEVRLLLGESTRLRTCDATVAKDLDVSLADSTLAAGAADFFTAQLKRHLPCLPAFPQPPSTHPERLLLLCGSLAAWEIGRAAQMESLGFTVKTLDDAIPPTIWQETHKLMLAIGGPKRPDAASLMHQLIDKAQPLLQPDAGLCIAMEGGATAMALIRRMGWTHLAVIPEGHVGVGTLQPSGGPMLRVKPGSYAWPEGCISTI